MIAIQIKTNTSQQTNYFNTPLFLLWLLIESVTKMTKAWLSVPVLLKKDEL